MAGFKTGGDDDMIADINVTPFVDIVLVLLIIFMATSTVIVRTALDLEIPKASKAEAKNNANMILSIELLDDKSLKLNGEAVTPDGLVKAIETEVEKNNANTDAEGKPQPTEVIITARGQQDYQDVVDVINLAKGAGVSGIALNTKPIPNDTSKVVPDAAAAQP